MLDIVIHGFEEHLRHHRLVRTALVSVFGNWARRFLLFARSQAEREFEPCLIRFTAMLREERSCPDWQIIQARDAVRIYYYQYRRGAAESHGTATPAETGAGSGASLADVLAGVCEECRLRRYSLKTEATYSGWVRRFYGYRSTVGLDGHPPAADDVKAFLTHLALDCTVSASTQNQAFNALLFLFRHVLRTDLEDMGETPRAKRGRKLPLVLSPSEMAQLQEADEPASEEPEPANSLSVGGGNTAAVSLVKADVGKLIDDDLSATEIPGTTANDSAQVHEPDEAAPCGSRENLTGCSSAQAGVSHGELPAPAEPVREPIRTPLTDLAPVRGAPLAPLAALYPHWPISSERPEFHFGMDERPKFGEFRASDGTSVGQVLSGSMGWQRQLFGMDGDFAEYPHAADDASPTAARSPP